MNALLVLPILLPLAIAALSLALRSRPALARGLGLAGSLAHLAVALLLLEAVRRGDIAVTQLGAWPAPFGITLVADIFAAVMVVLSSIVGLAVTVYSLATIDWRREEYDYHALLQMLQMGICGAFLTGDLFNLYVWFELMLIASFVLLSLGGERAQLEGAIKYVTLNLLSSAMLLSAAAMLYGLTGTLNMADLAVRLDDVANRGLVSAVGMLLLVSFGIKAALFPLFFWLPASYHTPPAAVSAVFAGMLTKVGVYAMIRVFTLLFPGQEGLVHPTLLILSVLTMTIGVLGAMVQDNFRRILSFHIISQIGYMVMGLALAGMMARDSRAAASLALAGSIFYIIHHIVVKANLFLVSGVTRHLQGTDSLARQGGLYVASPVLAAMFAVPALSLAGVPPFSGFFAKLALVRAGLTAGEHAVVAVALAVSLLTLYSMTKIWLQVFWKPAVAAGRTPRPRRPAPVLALIPIGALALLTVAIGLGAEPVMSLSSAAARQLLERQGYIQAVLGDARW